MSDERTLPRLDAASAVVCLSWPGEAERRADLARAGVPRLLFIEPGHAPPELLDLDEDWVRVPASVEEVKLRSEVLRRRSG